MQKEGTPDEYPVLSRSTRTSSISAQPCAQCPSFAALRYDITLCSLVTGEIDHLLDLPDEPRPLAASFADPQSSEGIRLIAKSEVLGTHEDDDDIEWRPEPFKIRPDSVNLE